MWAGPAPPPPCGRKKGPSKQVPSLEASTLKRPTAQQPQAWVLEAEASDSCPGPHCGTLAGCPPSLRRLFCFVTQGSFRTYVLELSDDTVRWQA